MGGKRSLRTVYPFHSDVTVTYTVPRALVAAAAWRGSGS